MKFFITVTAFCAIMSMTIAQTAEQKQKAENFFAECSKETGISSEAVQKLRSGDFSDPSPEAKVNLQIYDIFIFICTFLILCYFCTELGKVLLQKNWIHRRKW